MVNVYIMRIYADVIERGAKKLEDVPNDEMRAAVEAELNRRKESREELDKLNTMEEQPE